MKASEAKSFFKSIKFKKFLLYLRSKGLYSRSEMIFLWTGRDKDKAALVHKIRRCVNKGQKYSIISACSCCCCDRYIIVY